jgi:hypothetical protein
MQTRKPTMRSLVVRGSCLALAAALCLPAPLATMAQTAPQRRPAPAAAPARAATPAPTAPAGRAPAYTVKGFRNAAFGQSQEQVLAAIARDFGVKSESVERLTVQADGTTALVIQQKEMAPAPGPVTITYVFGKDRLIHVNVVWLLAGEPTAAQRGDLVSAGVKLSDYFKTFYWTPGKSGENMPTGPNAVTMFIGRDARGNAVEVSAGGVSFNRTLAGKTVASPTPAGPARLRVAYASAEEDRAVTTIKPGQF